MAKGGWQEFSRVESLQRGTPATEPTAKAQQRVRVQRTKAGKGGKMVTAITGPADDRWWVSMPSQVYSNSLKLIHNNSSGNTYALAA